ncbi:FAD-dependent oxidoreductase [Massilia sp. CCM 8733]|uniref:FAD-dependent oxidoreductase n=1 Tax=Massilia mucilaginosa TaxID=2609282 RepID=A0ABX0NSL2_9BURK|nr:FAD-binding oxidoreductase [Massilia mucilaginosa]NHZ89901.1 FAD-dependent oxidoreductase [Massilia mucilaginosa]
MTETFEYLVVGKGMIGAAALRYLSCGSERVAAIGPDEPVDAQAHDGVFSSHYDQGRICTQLSRDRLWGELTRQSMSCFAALEAASATHFYRPAGMLYIAPGADVRAIAALARATAVDHVSPARRDMAALCPSVVVPAGHEALLEMAPAGIIDPRALIRSQLSIAMRQGASVIRETVVAAEKTSAHWTLTTDQGRQFTAKNILICAGAYSNCFGFFREKIAIRVKSETTILVKVSGADAQRLSGMPAIGYQIDAPRISDVYLTPPLVYPDKSIYIKLGANTDDDVILHTLDDMQHWMKHGCRHPRQDMVQALCDLIPGLDVSSVQVKRCLVTYSDHGKPYIDALGNGLFVATAGNGSSAACSDTLGSLAADLMLERTWPAAFKRADFGVRLMPDSAANP